METTKEESCSKEGAYQVIKTTPILMRCSIPQEHGERNSVYYCTDNCLWEENTNGCNHVFGFVCEDKLLKYIPEVENAKHIVIHVGNYLFTPEAIPVDLEMIYPDTLERELSDYEDHWDEVNIFGSPISLLQDFGKMLYRIEIEDDQDDNECLIDGETVYVWAEAV